MVVVGRIAFFCSYFSHMHWYSCCNMYMVIGSWASLHIHADIRTKGKEREKEKEKERKRLGKGAIMVAAVVQKKKEKKNKQNSSRSALYYRQRRLRPSLRYIYTHTYVLQYICYVGVIGRVASATSYHYGRKIGCAEHNVQMLRSIYPSISTTNWERENQAQERKRERKESERGKKDDESKLIFNHYIWP